MGLRRAQTEPFSVQVAQEVELCQIAQEMGSNLVRIDYLQMGPIGVIISIVNVSDTSLRLSWAPRPHGAERSLS